MRLFITNPSPFARKCRIVVREKGLEGRVQEVVADPYANDPILLASNPLAQVPSLIAEGVVFNDSPLICDYLDRLGEGPRLIPTDEEGHWRARRLEVLADGALEMGVKWVLEKRRPEHERSNTWIDRWKDGLRRSLDALEAWAPEAEPLDIGVITTGVCLTWLGFRHPDFNWMSGRPYLTALQETLEKRPSFVDTYPRV